MWAIFKANEDEIISDVDVASLYPSLIIQYKFYPPHLGEVFLEVYKRIKDERRRRNTTMNDTSIPSSLIFYKLSS